MERCDSIFGQIRQIFSKREFFEALYDTKAATGIKGFGVWDHFVAMLFCQLGQAILFEEICGGYKDSETEPDSTRLNYRL